MILIYVYMYIVSHVLRWCARKTEGTVFRIVHFYTRLAPFTTSCLLWCVFQGYVDASPDDAFKELVVNTESSPSWNPSLIECYVCVLPLEIHSFCQFSCGNKDTSGYHINLLSSSRDPWHLWMNDFWMLASRLQTLVDRFERESSFAC